MSDNATTARNPVPQNVEIKTTLLYGIFASHKSYLIGVRNLMKREHADMLANKIIGTILPPELIEIIADYLYDMEQATVQKTWVTERSAMQKNIAKFEKGIRDCPALRGAQERIALSPIQTSLVQNSRPITGRNIRLLDPATTFYVHLSCTRPSLSLNLPPPLQAPDPVSPAIFYYAGRDVQLRVRICGNDDTRDVLHEDEATYMPGAAEPLGVPRRTQRLVKCEGVEQAMRDWDGDAVKKFVEMLGLVIVPFEEGEGNVVEPGLHIWQRIVGQRE